MVSASLPDLGILSPHAEFRHAESRQREIEPDGSPEITSATSEA